MYYNLYDKNLILPHQQRSPQIDPVPERTTDEDQDRRAKFGSLLPSSI